MAGVVRRATKRVDKVQSSRDKMLHLHSFKCVYTHICVSTHLIKTKAVVLWGHFCQLLGIVLHGGLRLLYSSTEYCLLLSLYYLYRLEDPLLRGEAKVLSYLCLAPGHCPSPPWQCSVHTPKAPHSLGKDQLVSVLYNVVIPVLNAIICSLNKDIRKA